MKVILIGILFLLSSCQWLSDRAIVSWTGDTIELLLEMSLRKSMIHDTPLKTMEALEAPDGVTMNKKSLCRCGTSLYGGIMTVIANDVKESSVKQMCKSMGKCFFKSKAPANFTKTCISHVNDGDFKKMARNRSKSILRFTKARRQLSSYCSKL